MNNLPRVWRTGVLLPPRAPLPPLSRWPARLATPLWHASAAGRLRSRPPRPRRAAQQERTLSAKRTWRGPGSDDAGLHGDVVFALESSTKIMSQKSADDAEMLWALDGFLASLLVPSGWWVPTISSR